MWLTARPTEPATDSMGKYVVCAGRGAGNERKVGKLHQQKCNIPQGDEKAVEPDGFLAKEGATWVPWSAAKATPDQFIRLDGTDFGVCQLERNNEKHVGTFTQNKCFVGLGGKEVSEDTAFDILIRGTAGGGATAGAAAGATAGAGGGAAWSAQKPPDGRIVQTKGGKYTLCTASVNGESKAGWLSGSKCAIASGEERKLAPEAYFDKGSDAVSWASVHRQVPDPIRVPNREFGVCTMNWGGEQLFGSVVGNKCFAGWDGKEVSRSAGFDVLTKGQPGGTGWMWGLEDAKDKAVKDGAGNPLCVGIIDGETRIGKMNGDKCNIANGSKHARATPDAFLNRGEDMISWSKTVADASKQVKFGDAVPCQFAVFKPDGTKDWAAGTVAGDKCVAEWGGDAKASGSYDVLKVGEREPVGWSWSSQMPNSPEKVKDGKYAVCAGRSKIGKTSGSGGECLVPMGGDTKNAIPANETQYLNRGDDLLKWYSNRAGPEEPIRLGGYAVCRTMFGDEPVMGTEINGKCYFEYDNKERETDAYDVLGKGNGKTPQTWYWGRDAPPANKGVDSGSGHRICAATTKGSLQRRVGRVYRDNNKDKCAVEWNNAQHERDGDLWLTLGGGNVTWAGKDKAGDPKAIRIDGNGVCRFRIGDDFFPGNLSGGTCWATRNNAQRSSSNFEVLLSN